MSKCDWRSRVVCYEVAINSSNKWRATDIKPGAKPWGNNNCRSVGTRAVVESKNKYSETWQANFTTALGASGWCDKRCVCVRACMEGERDSRKKLNRSYVIYKIHNFITGECSADEVKRKWKNLSYMKISLEKLSSGSGSKPSRRKWQHYDSLSFLRDTLLKKRVSILHKTFTETGDS